MFLGARVLPSAIRIKEVKAEHKYDKIVTFLDFYKNESKKNCVYFCSLLESQVLKE